MSVTIEWGKGHEATLENGVWSCGDALTKKMLTAVGAAVYEQEGSDPDPDLHRAQAVAEKLGGKVTKHEGKPGRPGVIY